SKHEERPVGRIVERSGEPQFSASLRITNLLQGEWAERHTPVGVIVDDVVFKDVVVHGRLQAQGSRLTRTSCSCRRRKWPGRDPGRSRVRSFFLAAGRS